MKHVLKHHGYMIVTAHAWDMFHEATGLSWTKKAISDLIAESKHVSIGDVRAHGYSPNYEGRDARGIKSWYAVSERFGWDCVFVISKCRRTGSDNLIVMTALFNKLVEFKELDERVEPKPVDGRAISPGTRWKSGDVCFECVVSGKRLVLEGELNGSVIRACTEQGRTRYCNPDDMARDLTAGMTRYKDEKGVVKRLGVPVVPETKS